MDSPRDTAPSVLDAERETARDGNVDAGTDGDRASNAEDGGGRDLRDVLRRLVVLEDDQADLSLSAVAEAAAGTDRLVQTS